METNNIPVETFERLVDDWKNLGIALNDIGRHFHKLRREEKRLYRMARDMECYIAICNLDDSYRETFKIYEYGESRYIVKHIIELWEHVQQYDQYVD